MVSGDKKLAEEAKKLLENVETVVVKEAIGRTAARCLSPVKARELIKKGRVRASKRVDRFRPFKIKPPINLKVSFVNTGIAEIVELVLGTKRVDGRAVSFSSKDLIEAYKTFRAMIMLAGTGV